jgi:recombinational DNA repair ATPase RecF
VQAPDLEIAKSAVVRFESAIQTAQDTKAGLSTKRAGLVSKLEAFGDDGLGEKISAAEEEIAVLRRRSDAYAQQVRALNLLRSTLSNAQSTMQAKYFKPIADELEPLLAQVIGKGDVTLGDDYGAARLRRGDLSEDILTLSGGTQEQIAVLTRLAYAKFMKKQGYPAPVFLDDALVYCDDARLDEMFTVLQYAAQDIQCIVLTCHERLFATMGGTQLKAEPWAGDY